MYNKMNPIENNLECPICLDDIDLESGDFLELDCCKNKGHIKLFSIGFILLYIIFYNKKND